MKSFYAIRSRFKSNREDFDLLMTGYCAGRYGQCMMLH